MRRDGCSEKSREAREAARELAEGLQQQAIEPEHLLMGLLDQTDGLVRPILQMLEARPEDVASRLNEELARKPKVSGVNEQAFVSSDLRKDLDAAWSEMQKLKDEYVSTEHLLLGLLAGRSGAAAILRESGVSHHAVYTALAELRGSQRVTDPNPEGKYQVLEKYTRDLTAMARQGKLDPVIGRDEEIRRVIQGLSRRTKNNPVLIGEPRVGKTAIAEGLAQRVAHGDVPSTPKDKRVGG